MLGLATLTLAAATPALAEDVYAVMFISPVSGLCMEAEGNGTGPWVKQVDCDFADDAQWWVLEYTGSSSLNQIRNLASGECLDSVHGWLSMQQCGPWDSQKWAMHTVDGQGAASTRALREDDEGRCIDIPNGTTSTYWLQAHACHYDWNQWWTVFQPNGFRRTVNW